ncbi:MAG: hypothetical protein GY856_39780 [bacterium]|nr:hypothetical protein [bacterium]
MKKLACILCVLTLLAFVFGSLAQEATGFKVVINADNPTIELEKKKVAKMFLKRLPRWDDDEHVMPVDQMQESLVRQAFSKSVHGKSVSMIKSYWQRMIFSGREVPPEEVATDAQVLEFVRREPGGIGYVAEDAELGSGVKELTVTD